LPQRTQSIFTKDAKILCALCASFVHFVVNFIIKQIKRKWNKEKKSPLMKAILDLIEL